MQKDSSFFSVADLATEEGVSPRFICGEITKGRLPAYRVGGRGYRISRSDVEIWREGRKVIPRRDVVGEALAEMRGGK